MAPRKPVDMEAAIGSILLAGVLLSMSLVSAGLLWHWWRTGTFRLDYTLPATNVAAFVLSDVQQLAPGAARPRLLVNLGIAVLMLTPYLRVVVSVIYFATAERDWKYVVFTTFVLATLTYSLLH